MLFLLGMATAVVVLWWGVVWLDAQIRHDDLYTKLEEVIEAAQQLQRRRKPEDLAAYDAAVGAAASAFAVAVREAEAGR